MAPMQGIFGARCHAIEATARARSPGQLFRAAAVASAISVVACVDEDEPAAAADATAAVKVELEYPNERMQSSTSSVHLWAFHRNSDDRLDLCPALIGGALDPYDPKLRPLADQVTLGGPDSLEADAVAVGPAALYVEAVDAEGEAVLAACAEREIQQPSISVTLDLGAPSVFDCTDPATPEGSPCDDAKLCTVGTVCRDGECGGGRDLDCASLLGTCYQGECNELLGCLVSYAPGGTACDDGLYCTVDDACEAGVCAGEARDCTEVGPCEVGVCTEDAGGCMTQPVAVGTVCDDGDALTINDQCDAAGVCSGT